MKCLFSARLEPAEQYLHRTHAASWGRIFVRVQFCVYFGGCSVCDETFQRFHGVDA